MNDIPKELYPDPKKGKEEHYSVCNICGETSWAYSKDLEDPNAPGVVHCYWLQEGFGTIICGVCNNVYSRNPELVEWVHRVLMMHDLKLGLVEIKRG